MHESAQSLAGQLSKMKKAANGVVTGGKPHIERQYYGDKYKMPPGGTETKVTPTQERSPASYHTII